jgi:enoyl-CoA hydratase/carnithine racemase|tara:strand:+ start:657 stop:1430 length:774 start_codon:yes stop_codon:yes gene_type:complete
MSNDDLVLVNDDTGVRTLILNRPEALNAFNGALFNALTEALLAADADDTIRVIVLTGQGRAFSSGMDLVSAGSGPSYRYGFPDMVDVMVDFSKPIIIAMNGVGVGVGSTIVGLADFVFMAANARMRCPFSALGLTAEAASTYTFPNLMGRQNASWFMLSAEWMSAEECHRTGLVREVLPDEGFLEAVQMKARKMAAFPLSSLRATKAQIMAPHKANMKAAAKSEDLALVSLFKTSAHKEAIAAFREKREPNFTDVGE